MQKSIDNLKNIDRIDTGISISKKRNRSKDLKKSKTKPIPHSQVKSHLYESIESSRQKSNHKYYNPNRIHNIANKENED